MKNNSASGKSEFDKTHNTFSLHIMNTRERTALKQIAEWVLIAIVFFLPIQSRWVLLKGELNGGSWEYGMISLYGIDILVCIFIIIGILYLSDTFKEKMLWGSSTLERQQFAVQNALKPRTPLLQLSQSQILAVLILVVAFFSMAFAGNKINALFWWIKLAEGIVLYFTLSLLSLNPHRIASTLVASGVVQSIIAFVQFTTQSVVGSRWFNITAQDPSALGVQVVEGPMGRILRAYGTLPHPNMLGGFLVVALIVGLMLYSHERKHGHRLLYGLGLCIMGTGVWMTFSRQSWIALALGVVVIVAYTFITKREFPKILAVGVGYILLPLIVFSLLFPTLISTRLSPEPRLEQKSINERTEFIDQSLSIVRTEWGKGIGIGNYTAYLHTIDDSKAAYEYQPVHNIYLLVFAELGIFGFLTFLLFVLSHAVHLQLDNEWIVGWGVGLIGLFTIGLFDHYLWTLHFGILLFWITAGMFESNRNDRKIKQET